jgi:TPR repeat protein
MVSSKVEEIFNEAVKLRKKWKYHQAFELLSELTGYAPAQNQLGEMHYKGLHVERNLDKAFELFNKAAKQGYAPAQYNLGEMYEEGQFVEQNFEQSFKYYKLSADQNCVEALNHLGWLYKDGMSGVKQDSAKAVEYFTKAVDLGYSHSQYELAMMYHKGEGVKQDDQKALELCKKAVDQGYPAQWMIDEINKEPHALSVLFREHHERNEKQ